MGTNCTPVPTMWLLQIIFLLVSLRGSTCLDEKPLEFEDIVDKTTYDKMRPPKPEGRATTVSFHVTVMSLDTIDEGSMTYAADVFFAQEWKDHRLILPENMTREYRLLPVEWLHLIWRPDSFFKNAKKVTFQTMTIPNHYVWLYKDRTILYMVKLTLLLSCAMHFENYPHDEQICRLSMESLSHTTDDLVFVWLPEDKVPLAVDSGIELPQLELVSNVTGDCTSVYSTGNFTCLELIFKFRRRLGYYLFHTYIPTCLIVMMSWISFWIKPEAVPARVTLGVTSLLTLSTQHANSQKSLPPVSYIKAIDIFMSSCTVFVFLSLIEYAFVNVMMGDISEVERKDKTSHLRNIIVTANTNLGYSWQKYPQGNFQGLKPQHAGQPGQQTSQPLLASHLNEAEEAAIAIGATLTPGGNGDRNFHGDHCPKHGNSKGDEVSSSNNKESPSNAAAASGGQLSGSTANIAAEATATSTTNANSGPASQWPGTANALVPVTPSGNNRKHDPKEIMKKRRERAICIDRVSRVIFPSTFILLNIIYWLVFSEILDAIRTSVGADEGGGH